MKVKLQNENFKNNYVMNLLKARGIENIEEFLSPSEKNLQSFSDLNNINEAITLFDILVYKGNKPIGIIVDSDCDGYCSAAIMYQYIRNLLPNKQIDYYIHSEKQHGLEDMWEILAEKNYDLLIVTDAGSNDSKYACNISYPILVLDHHIVDEAPYAENLNIVNNNLSLNYKNKSLSGGGVVYQFCRALDSYYKVNYADFYIDLAALAICGDMMSGLEVENQYIWKKGFNSINNLFLKELIDKQKYSMSGEINPTTIAFYIVPFINAMVRVGTMDEKDRMFRAFINGNELVLSGKRGAKGQFEKISVESARECSNAKARQSRLIDNIEANIEMKIFKEELLNNKILFIQLDENYDFPSELNGLLAMRLVTKYNRPVMVGRLNDEGFFRGSARAKKTESIQSFKKFLENTNMFEYASGHDFAFGYSLYYKNLDKFISYANENLNLEDFKDNFYIVNFMRSANDNDIKDMVKDVSKYKDIWSQECSEPLIYIHDINITNNEIQIIGANKDTLKFSKNDITYIKFHAKDLINELINLNNIKLNIVGRGNLNYWNGNTIPQIFIDDYEVIDNTYEF